MTENVKRKKKSIVGVLGNFFSMATLLWIFIIILLFLTVFQFFYFSSKTTKLEVELVSAQKKIEALQEKELDGSKDALGITLGSQKAMVEKMNQNTAAFENNFKSLFEVTRDLQKQVKGITEYINKVNQQNQPAETSD